MNKVRLGDICDTCLGKMLDAEKNKGKYEPYLANINVRWGSFDLDTLSLMRFEEHEAERYGINKGDLIICEGGEPGRCAVWENEIPNMKIQKALHRLRPHECLDVYYLYYWFLLSGKQNLLERHFTKTTIKHLTGIQLNDLEIDLIDLIEQKKIAAVLQSFDNKIKNNNKIIKILQQQVSMLYNYWFTQFDFPNENGKPYKSSGGKMMWNEELKREIPEGWIVKPVSELLNVVTGKEDANFSVIKGKYKFFTCSKDALLCNEFAFDGKAILIAGNGDFNVKHYSGKFNAYQRTYVLIPENEKYYGTIYLAAARLINMFKTGSNGSIVKFITKDDVDNIMITIPNNDTYFEVINHIITTIESKQRENEELSDLRDWLLPMLMNGQVTVE